ncbi:unnamed protein product [Linum tenue]|uniref:Uncharacterized protein n=1 Tax=Linum tenue TaxID=586396 RepID=A0AAV0LNE0_9ROSI|nr:unnamed protein product [Linum tenue]
MPTVASFSAQTVIRVPDLLHRGGSPIPAKPGRADRRDCPAAHLGVSVFHVDCDEEARQIQQELVFELDSGRLWDGSQCACGDRGHLDYRHEGYWSPFLQTLERVVTVFANSM